MVSLAGHHWLLSGLLFQSLALPPCIHLVCENSCFSSLEHCVEPLHQAYPRHFSWVGVDKGWTRRGVPASSLEAPDAMRSVFIYQDVRWGTRFPWPVAPISMISLSSSIGLHFIPVFVCGATEGAVWGENTRGKHTLWVWKTENCIFPFYIPLKLQLRKSLSREETVYFLEITFPDVIWKSNTEIISHGHCIHHRKAVRKELETLSLNVLLCN